MNARKHFIEAAQGALDLYYPGYACAFAAGSVVRGQQTALSDIDLVVLFNDPFEDIHRHTVTHEGWPIEFFIHNERAQDYFMDKDRLCGVPVMIDMVASGIPIPRDSALAAQRKERARALLAAGPPLLTGEERNERRYVLTNLLDDLDSGRPLLDHMAVVGEIFMQLGDLHLRRHQKWSGAGKSLARRLREEFPELAYQLEAALKAAIQRKPEDLIVLANGVLAEVGGRLWHGHRLSAPDHAWKEFKMDHEL